MSSQLVGKRRSNGCMPCKARKKKCDGQKPTCVGCERNILLCRWSEAQQVAPPKRATKFTSSLAKCRLGPPLGLARQKAHIQKQDTNKVALTKDLYLNSTFVKHPVSQVLYQHWFYQTADNISALQGTSNAFYTELPKLAHRYPDMVLPSLLAFSGVHYCNKYFNPVVKEMAWSHLAQALRALKYALTKHVSDSNGDEALPLLVTTLILSFIETCRGDTEGNYQHHSRAARPLLISVLSSGLYDGEDATISFVKELYAYVACITDLTADSGQLIAMNPEAESRFGPLVGSKSPGMLLGCAYELFHAVPLVSDICQRQRNAMLFSEKVQQEVEYLEYLEYLKEDYEALHLKVSSWDPPSGSSSDFANCGRVYQQALLIYLEMSFIAEPDPQTLSIRGEIVMALLGVIPENVSINVTLCWPLSLVGSVAEDFEYRGTIRQRFRQMYQDFGIGNILTIVDFLDRLENERTAVALQSSSPFQATSLETLMQRCGTNVSFI